MPPSKRPLPLSTCILAILLAMGVMRFAFYFQSAVSTLLQFDFGSIFFAGKVFRENLDMFKNHYLERPDLWDGVAGFYRSRWLYPPVVAVPFAWFSWVPYSIAKVVWSLLIVACLPLSVLILKRSWKLEWNTDTWLFFWTMVIWSTPLLYTVESGQIDLLVLLLIVGAWALDKKTARHSLLGGVLLAIAITIKLHTIYLLPFAFLRGRMLLLGGVALGAVAIGLFSLATVGPEKTIRYVKSDMSSVGKYGPFGERTDMLPEIRAKTDLHDVSSLREIRNKRLFPTYTYLEGKEYLVEFGRFTFYSCSLALLISYGTLNVISISAASLILYTPPMALLGYIELKRKSLFKQLSPQHDMIFWSLAITTTLFAAPLTWEMNCIWLLVPLAMALALIPTQKDRSLLYCFIPILWGIFLTFVIDESEFFRKTELLAVTCMFKPYLGDFLAFAGCFLLYRKATLPAQSAQ